MLLRPRRPQLRKTVDWDLGLLRLNVAELAAMSRTAGKNCRAAAEETRSRGMWVAGKGGAEAGMRRGEVRLPGPPRWTPQGLVMGWRWRG